MATKGDLVRGAYSILRISGLTIDPSPEDTEVGLMTLEDMAAEFEEGNICIQYNFEDENDIDPATDSGVQRAFNGSLKELLAWRLAMHFGKQIPPTLQMLQKKSMSFLTARTAVVRQTAYPSRQPLGSGNTFRNNRWVRFNRKEARAPISCDTKTITYGGILDFEQDFNYFLKDETIASYITDTSDNLTIVSDSFADGVISYRVQCDDTAADYQFVEFKLTTNTGRIQSFIVNFAVTPDKVNIQP